MPLLDVKDLIVEFGDENKTARAVDGVSFEVNQGEVLCLVGESGSGKSVTALSLARLLPSPPVKRMSGRITLDGHDVLQMSKQEMRKIRGGTIAYIFQDPGASLNPVLKISTQIRESLRLHRPEANSPSEVIRLLSRVGIAAPETRINSYPHQLSGGMQQRVMIAMALAAQPRLLIADEPTTALDVTIQAQIIDLLTSLKASLGMGILLITHNFGLVAQAADRVAVMYAGQIVETGSVGAILNAPRHPYTRALLQSVPQTGMAAGVRLKGIPGSVPQSGRFPAGCRFHPRCSLVQDDCRRDPPPMIEVEAGHQVRCPYWMRS